MASDVKGIQHSRRDIVRRDRRVRTTRWVTGIIFRKMLLSPRMGGVPPRWFGPGANMARLVPPLWPRRRRLPLAALAQQPWTRSTGPRTAAGKANSAANGCWRQRGATSVRAFRRQLDDLSRIVGGLNALQRLVSDTAAEKASQLQSR